MSVREVTRATDPVLRGAHRLLAGTLPATEVVPLREWHYALAERGAGVWSDQRWHLLAAQRGPRVVGLVSGTYLGSLNLGMIGYLVLDPSAQGRGIGPRLRQMLRRCFERDARQVRGAALTALVGEVAPANPWLRHLVRRTGAIALDLEYYQPALRAGAQAPALVLYYQPLQGRRRSLPVAETRRLLYAIWRRLYRIAKPLDHPLFRRMLRQLRGRTRIGARQASRVQVAPA